MISNAARAMKSSSATLHSRSLSARFPTAVQAALTERLEHARAKLALYEYLRGQLLAGRSEDEYLRQAERLGPYLTLLALDSQSDEPELLEPIAAARTTAGVSISP